MNSVIEGQYPIKGFVSELRVEIGDREAAAELAAQEMVKAAATYTGAQEISDDDDVDGLPGSLAEEKLHGQLTGQMELGAIKYEVVGSGFEDGRFYTYEEMAEKKRQTMKDYDEARNHGLAEGYAQGYAQGLAAGENNVFIALGRKALGLT